MMNKKRTHKLWTSKYILALPLILLLLMALNAKELMAAWENSKLSPKSSEKIIVLQSGNSSGQLPPVSVIKNLTSQQVAELIRTDTLRTARKKSRIWGSMGNNDSIYYYDHNGNKIHPSKQEIDEFNEVNRQRFSEITKSFRETNFQFKDLWKDDSLRKKYQIDFSKEMEKFRFHADTINLHINTDKLLKEMQDIEFSTKNFNLFYDDLKSQKLSDKDIKELKESMEKLNKMLDDPKFKENMEELRQGMRDLRLKLNRQEFGIYDFQPKLKNDSLFFNRYFRKKTEKPTVSVEIKPEVEPFKRLDKADADIRFMLLDHSQSSGLN